MKNIHDFTGLGVNIGSVTPSQGQITPFQPNSINRNPVFTFMGQIAETQIQVNVLWNSIGQRYWLNILNAGGSLLLSRALTATPSQTSPLKINLLETVSSSQLYFYEDVQAFQILV